MIRRPLLYPILLLLNLFPIVGHTEAAVGNDTLTIERLQKQALNAKLHTNTRWMRLLHYQKKLIGQTQYTLVRSPAFFITKKETRTPKTELLAAIRSLLSPAADPNQHWGCKFPARARWLKESLKLRHLPVNVNQCRDYNLWRKQINAESLWLVFPAAHLNSPSSMFGHTLLRLDPPLAQKKSKLLSKAVNYAANVNQKDSEILYAYKGLFGGYPGEYSIVPYHKKVKEYGLIERRDIWEYKLNITPNELDWLLRHLWELKDVEFSYFFSSKNCSYQLLALLDVAREGPSITHNFPLLTIPVDTVRVLDKMGWIDSIQYRPSQAKIFYAYESKLNDKELELVKDLQTDSPKETMAAAQPLSLDRQQMVLETAYKLTRINKKTIRPNHSLKLLKYRSKLGKKLFNEPVVHGHKPEQSHYSSRVSVGPGSHKPKTHIKNSEQINGVYLSYRPTFHGLDDRLLGFTPGAQINFLQTGFFITENGIQLEHFTLLDIRSLSESDAYIKQLSWQVVGGAQRKLNTEGKDIIMPHVSAEAGQTYRFKSVRFYALAGFHTEYDRTASKALSIGPSFDLGLALQTNQISSELRYEYEYNIQTHVRKRLSWAVNTPLAQNWSIGLNLMHESFESKESLKGTLSLNHYF